MSTWSVIVDIIVICGTLVAVLDYFGIKPKPNTGAASMPNRKWKLVIMLGLVALSLGLTGYAFYRSLRPKIVEKIIEKPVDRIVEKQVPLPCPEPARQVRPEKQAKTQSQPQQPSMKQDCGGGNCAQSSGQTGGITGQVFVNTGLHFLITDDQQSIITQAMKPFGGRKAIIIVNGHTPDAAQFAQRLASAMRAANIDAQASGGMSFSEDASAPLPIQIQYGDNDAEAGKALMKALVDSHATVGQIGYHYYEGKPGQLTIIVTPQAP